MTDYVVGLPSESKFKIIWFTRNFEPLKVLLPAVVFLFVSFSLSEQVLADEFSLALSASHIVPNNMYGSWRTIQLQLGMSYSDSDVQDHCVDPEYHYGRYGMPYLDHLVVQSLDDPSDRGFAVPRFCIICQQATADDNYARWDYWEDNTYCHHSRDTCAQYCMDATFNYGWNISSFPLYMTLPECGKWRIWYLADHDFWFVFCPFPGVDSMSLPQRRTILTCFPTVYGGCSRVDRDLVGYINSLPDFCKTHVDIDMGPPCPEQYPPLSEGQVRAAFRGYIKPDGSNGDNWLPTPGDSIGLVFSVEANPTGSIWQMAYHIWDMSMWKGECLNSPRYMMSIPGWRDPDPATTGLHRGVPPDSLSILFPNWDFTVGDPRKYSFYVLDTTIYEGKVPANPLRGTGDTLGPWSGRPIELPQSRPKFRTDLVAFHRAQGDADTLWLKARDYAAHCLVTPEVGGGKDRRMREFVVNIRGNIQRLWTISVPRDYDGNMDVGVSYGDYMADAWEEAVELGQDIRYFLPFVTQIPHVGLADYDDKPTGRDIDGDNFCNFAEYRGLMIADDSTNTRHGHHHRRLNPNHKTVVVHVRGNMGLDDSVRQQMPGYVYKMDSAEVLFTDSIRFFPDFEPFEEERGLIERIRFDHIGRDINFNRAGAGLWYYGFGFPLNYPMARSDTIRAVTFWRWNRLTEPPFFQSKYQNIDSCFGATSWSGPTFVSIFHRDTLLATIPGSVVRSTVLIDNYNRIRDKAYRNDLPRWREDFPIECRKTIAHEFGHCVGMYDIPYDRYRPVTIMSGGLTDISSHRFVISSTDSTFADSSKAEFSTRRR